MLLLKSALFCCVAPALVLAATFFIVAKWPHRTPSLIVSGHGRGARIIVIGTPQHGQIDDVTGARFDVFVE